MRKVLFAILIAVVAVAAYSIGRGKAARAVSASPGRRVLYYVDPMHPAYKSDKPGIAPDCGMQLEPVYADGGAGEAVAADLIPAPAGTIKLDSDKQALIGVRTVAVETGQRARSVRLLGRVAAEDTRLYRINSAVQGWVQETHDDSVGEQVKKDQKLATFYSPEFVAFVNGYLAATERGTSEMKEFVRSVQYSADRLRALGMSETQIKEVAKNRQVPSNIFIVSPTDGFIVSRNISTGMRFDRQAEFYQIADLSKVWIIAEIFENEAGYFRPGMLAQVSLPGQRKSMPARITNVLPQVDSATRTLKLRLEADNPTLALRPDMFVDVELPVPTPSGLTVPMDAVIDFGLKKRVFVDLGDGKFAPREIETGWQAGDRVQVVRGLVAGDQVVASGTFLLDSESRLRGTAAGVNAPPATAGNRGDPRSAKSQLKPAMANEKGRMVRDPKCGMMVDSAEAAKAGRSFPYHGTTYYFCSQQDKDDFVKNPGRYLTSGAEVALRGAAGHD